MPMFEPGQHVARVVNFDIGRSSAKKTPCIQLVFEFVEGENKGKQITAWRYITGDATERTLKDLRVCGWNEPVGSPINHAMPGLGATKVRITVEEEEYNGKARMRVTWINSMGGAPAMTNRSDEDDLARINASIVNHLKRSQPVEGEVIEGAQATRVEVEGTAAEDDIPF